jgi:hypothetical protein
MTARPGGPPVPAPGHTAPPRRRLQGAVTGTIAAAAMQSLVSFTSSATVLHGVVAAAVNTTSTQ